MARLRKKKGVIIDRHDLTILDTREMEWEDFPGFRGSKVKVLSRDAQGEPEVFLLWFPARAMWPDGARLRPPHFHRTVRESYYILNGVHPSWEYESAERQHGELVPIREGFYLDRRPGSVHAGDSGGSETGCLMLTWRSGRGNWGHEPEASTETLDVESKS
jgi:hypothetical protein